MIDSFFRTPYQRAMIDPLLKRRFITNIPPSLITLFSCGAGLLVLPLLAFHFSYSALIALLFSGFLDTLDGSIARRQNLTSEKGAALDIFSDRLVEGSVILGLCLYDPSRGLLTLLMLFGALLCVTSFLIAAIFTQNKGKKSFHYSPGLIERAEAFIFFSLLILFPSLFAPLSGLFSILMAWTALRRIYEFLSD